MIEPREYVRFIGSEYLADYVPAGGSAVKFVVAEDEPSAAEVRERLRPAAEQVGCVFVSVDAAEVKVHLIDQVFFEIAKHIDWRRLARDRAVRALRELGFEPREADERLDLDVLAAVHEYHAAELRRDFKGRLQRDILGDPEMSHEFRLAMLRLCVAEAETDAQSAAERDAVLAWLMGELRLISALKSALIFQRIARHNARDMLASLTHWLAVGGYGGLVLQLDIRRCALQRVVGGEGIYYTKAIAIDVYELLRQLIDSTDDLTHCFVLVLVSPETLYDPRRGIREHYDALKTRIWNEVHDRSRDNPLAALVHSGELQ